MAVDISSELEIIKEEPLGESVAGAIVSALNSIHSYAYSSVDISSEITAIASSPEGSKIRIAIHDAIKKLAMADVEEPNPIIEITEEEYAVLGSYDTHKIYAMIDPMHTWVYTFNVADSSFTGRAKRFDNSEQAAEYIRSNIAHTDYKYGVRIGDGPNYYSKYNYVAFRITNEDQDWPDRVYGAMTEAQALSYMTTYGCNYMYPVDQFVAAFPVTRVGSFSGCTNLYDIYIGNSVTEIDQDTFSGCTALETIRVNKAEDSILGSPWGAPNADVSWIE